MHVKMMIKETTVSCLANQDNS